MDFWKDDVIPGGAMPVATIELWCVDPYGFYIDCDEVFYDDAVSLAQLQQS